MDISKMTKVPCIEESVPLDPCYPTVSDRYFAHYYYVPRNQIIKQSEDSPALPQLCEDKCAKDQENGCNMDADSEERPLKRQRLHETLPLNVSEESEETKNCNDRHEMDVDNVTEDIIPDKGNLSISECGVIRDNNTTKCNEVISDLVKDDKKYHLSGEETLVMVHSNKLCIVSLSPYHPIVKQNKAVTKVEYDVFGTDRLSNEVSGKGKRGAQVMGSKATICRLHTADGLAYNITCGARGKLVQVNKTLVSDPDKARSACGNDGWLAVVMPKLQQYDQMIETLMPAQQYKQLWDEQQQQ